MSALAKPMIHSTRATSGGAVNAEEILTVEELTVNTPAGAVASTFQINFTMKDGTSPKNITWKYATVGDMNTDYAAIIALISTVVP